MTPQISVVIPAYNSASLLERCLTSLENQSTDLQLFEVIVVDDGSSDNTQEVLESFQKEHPLQLKYKQNQNSGPATARNDGVAMASTDWIAFLDADVIAHRQWIERALTLIEEDPDAAGFEGRTEVNNRERLTPFTHQTENFYGGRYPTCNLVLRKVFCDFYTQYRIPFREDTDLAFCILESGFRIPFDEELVVYHPPLSPNYLRPIYLAKRYYYDGLLRRRFPQRYKRNLDAHVFLGYSVPHIKKKIYGCFLIAQLAFLLSLLCMSSSSGWTALLGSGYLAIYLTSCWMSIKTTDPSSRTLKDMMAIALVINVVPWVLYLQLLQGWWHFRKEPAFSSDDWLKEIGVKRPHLAHSVVIISTADWDHPFWTNKQHIASRLAQRGSKILYIESLGLRQMTTSYRDLKRIYQRTFSAFFGVREVEANVYVWSPLVIPFHRFDIIRRLNLAILHYYIRYFCWRLEFQKPLLWSYNPIIAPLAEKMNFEKIIYHCVDELKEAPGMPAEILEYQERIFCEKADLIFTTSPKLYESRKQLNPQTHYLPNPCDFQHFHKAVQDIEVAPILNAIPEPRLGFVGALSRYKVDADLLQLIAEKHPEWSIVLLGQIGEGEPGVRFDGLLKLPNVHFLGPQPYKKLPHYLKGFQAAMLPCPDNGYTQNMFPLKFFEYLAAGLPVVATALPALEAYRKACYWCSTYEEFVESISKALQDTREQSPLIQNGIDLAKQNTWDKRVESMLEILENT